MGGETARATAAGADGVSGGNTGDLLNIQDDGSRDEALESSGYLSHSMGSTIPPNQEKRTADKVSNVDSR